MDLPLFFQLVLGCALMVWVPLVLAQIDASLRPGGGLRFWLLRVASLTAILSLLFPAGSAISGALALGWGLLGLYAAFAGVRRLLFWGVIGGARTAVGYGLLGLAGGVVWFGAARTEAAFLGFDEPWKTLTAIHFHYAAAILPLGYALMVARIEDLGRAGPARAGALALFVWFVGFAAVARGINGSPTLEKIGAVLMACAGAILLVTSLRVHRELARGVISKLLLGTSVLAGAVALTLAVLYAFRTGKLAEFSAMAKTHGVLNAFVWPPALLFLAVWNGWSLSEPRERLPFARWSAGRKVGAAFFDPHVIAGHARGLTDRFAELARAEFDPAQVDPGVRDFYERTADFELDVTATSAPAFAWLWRKMVGPWFGRREQLHLPDRDKKIAGRIVTLDESRDGRARPRGWIRTDVATGKAVYVAAYAVHAREGASYMNIAFPLPFGNMTSILLPVHHPVRSGGLRLTTLSGARPSGDQGVFAVVRGHGLRLPLNETIDVWREGEILLAEHRMWFFGWPYLTLNYRMRTGKEKA